MSCLDSNNCIQVTIPSVEIYEKITHYTIVVQLHIYTWKTSHRYSEFGDLHDVLVAHHGLARDLLPPKKIIGNKDPVFIEKRRKDLELYLQTVVGFMSPALPEQLAEFLEVKHYEINLLLQDMARYYFKEGDNLLQRNEPSIFNPLQLMAISRQMLSPNTLIFAYGKETDFANIVDFCSNVTRVIIQGSYDTYKASNIIMNELRYNMSAFKSLQELSIYEACISKIDDLGPARRSVRRLIAKLSGVTGLSEVLACDSLHRELGADLVWATLEYLDLSSNAIATIDESVTLAPRLQHLNLSTNKLKDVGTFLTKLPQLVYLNLSNNQLQDLSHLHTKFGNIKKLDLSQNNISCLEGLSKVYSVVYLNLASNNIAKVAQVESVCQLPCLEELLLTGNPLATIIDYRAKVLERFGRRASEICLDNERPTQKELDKVAVLQALNTAREGRLPTLTLSHPLPSMPGSLLLERPDMGTIAKE